jgi:SAM-dependent methyltransferase
MVYIEEFPDRMDFIDDAKVDLDNSEKEKIEYWSFPKLYDKHQEVFDHFFGKRLSQLNKHHQGNISSMLDIGSGYGFWMKFCRDRGIDVYGIDPSKETVDWGREKYGLDMDVGLL